MTTYGVITSSALNLSVLSGTYPIRISRVEAKGVGAPGAVTTVTFQVLRYTGASHSGGSLLTPHPMRANAPASTVTARSGATTSGTSAVLEHVSTTTPSGGSEPPLISPTYAPPFDLLLDPGMALRAQVTGPGSSHKVDSLLIFFEELRQLSWPL